MIVLHAGMPKSGSSSIQQWLGANTESLRQHGFTLVRAPANESGGVTFEPYEHGPLNSGWIVNQAVNWAPSRRIGLVDVLINALVEATEKHGDIVLSGESFAHMFWSLPEDVLIRLEQLSKRHRLRIAYYVRPQHSALEAAWRQWGFRSGHPPSVYVDDYASHLHHARTCRGVNACAPGLEFEPRALLEQHLDRGDLICDFAGRFLGIEAAPMEERKNSGLPLEAAKLLSAAPPGMFWSSTDDNGRLEQIKGLLDGNGIPREGSTIQSRFVLRRYAHERFADENAELGWVDFVPPPPKDLDIPDLDALDRFWAPQASPAELAIAFQALTIAIGRTP